MISWMQKNNKYLVVTIWVASIAFIGASFVGWGSVKLGSTSNAVAQVGDITISKTKYAFTYNNLYSQYAQKLGSKFDKEVAKRLGLDKVAFNNLIQEALLLNLANEYGIIVTDKEVALELLKYPIFKDKSGKFNKSYYENFLRARGLKTKDFENILRDDIKIRKLVNLIDIKPLDFEKEVIKSIFSVKDKIKYTVIKRDDINVSVNDDELKKYWQKNKMNYLTKTKYTLDILWTSRDDLNITDSDIEKFYNKNSFNYLDEQGKIKPLKDVKDLVKKDLKLEKLKKYAAIDRSRFKKGKIKASETLALEENDKRFNSKIWEEIKNAKEGTYLKPKAVGNRYVTIHLNKKIPPKEMSFQEAKELVKKDYLALKKDEILSQKADELIKKGDGFNLEPKNYITLSKFEVLPSLTPQDSLQVTKHIFGSSKKIDKVNVNDGVVVYKVVEQKIEDSNSSNTALDKEITSIKSGELTANLIKELYKRYTIKSFVKGF